jgi:signal transduction histidine kinase
VQTHYFGFPSRQDEYDSDSDEEITDLSAVNMMVKSDKLRVKQVLMNLYSNAVKFTKDKGNIKIVCQYIKGTGKATNLKRSGEYELMVKDRSTKFTNFSEDVMNDKKRSIDKVFTQGSKDKIVISVIDTGVGIENKEQRKIFKMFG